MTWGFVLPGAGRSAHGARGGRGESPWAFPTPGPPCSGYRPHSCPRPSRSWSGAGRGNRACCGPRRCSPSAASPCSTPSPHGPSVSPRRAWTSGSPASTAAASASTSGGTPRTTGNRRTSSRSTPDAARPWTSYPPGSTPRSPLSSCSPSPACARRSASPPAGFSAARPGTASAARPYEAPGALESGGRNPGCQTPACGLLCSSSGAAVLVTDGRVKRSARGAT